MTSETKPSTEGGVARGTHELVNTVNGLPVQLHRTRTAEGFATNGTRRPLTI